MKNLVLILAAFLFFASSCKKTKGTISMTYEKAIAVYGDIDAIRALPLLTTKQPVENPSKIFIGDNYILVGEEGKGIHIFDNSNMTNPQRLSFIQIPYNKEFYVKGNILYAESLYDVIKVDISNVYNPTLIARAINIFGSPKTNDKGESLLGFNYVMATDNFELDSPEAKELKKKGKIHLDYLDKLIPDAEIPATFTSTSSDVSSMNRIAVSTNTVYFLTGNRLHILDDHGSSISDARTINLSDGMETVYTEGNRLYIGSEDNMIIYNITQPNNPSRISDYNHTNSCDPVMPHNDVAYLTLRDSENSGCNSLGENTLNVIDLSDETEPTLIQSIDMVSPYGVTLIGYYLFVGEGENGMAIFNATNPKNLVEIKRITNVTAFDIMLHPTNPNIILVTNNNGLEQFTINYNTLDLTPLSTIDY